MSQTKTCVLCLEEKSIIKFRCRSSINGFYVDNVCKACLGKGERARLKLKMFAALGNKCSCCGESNPYFLSLDHVNNDGAEHRKKLNEQQIYREAERQGWPKDKYQVLCMNCNFAKGHFGECPHQRGVTTEQAMIEIRGKANTKIGDKFRNFKGMEKGWFKPGFDGRRLSEQKN